MNHKCCDLCDNIACHVHGGECEKTRAEDTINNQHRKEGNMVRMIVRLTDGKTFIINAENDKTYEALSANIGAGGMIEFLPFFPGLTDGDNDITVYGNEESKLNGMPINAFVAFRGDNTWGDAICGPMIFTASNDMGETVDLSDEGIKKVMTMCKGTAIVCSGYTTRFRNRTKELDTEKETTC